MRWTTIPSPPENTIRKLAQSLNFDYLLAKLLVIRGIDTYNKARLFFKPTFNDLHDPFLMKDMRKAVERIEKAISNNEKIMVYGDYDVDGTTSVALVSSYLKSFYPKVITYIPDRYSEGYGISFQSIDFAQNNQVTLIIALDCGIKAHDKIDYAKTKHIDFIIADHHLPGSTIPNAIAVLDPKQTDCQYPYKELCGCGIGFKIIQALAHKKGETAESLKQYLDLVAVAIGADIVPITGENRILAKFGLEVINTNPRNGIKMLMPLSERKLFTISDIVFKIAPRINAAGRIKHADTAVKLLSEFNKEQAYILAKEINQYNDLRKNLDKKTTEEALIQIIQTQQESLNTTVVFDKNWHKGVIGIVASRLIEKYYKPTLVFTESEGKMVASARSVKNFDIHNALEQCADLIEQFGGHKYAAGLTIAKEKFTAFRERFEQVVSQSICELAKEPILEIDTEINLTNINDKFVRILSLFEPFGPENMTPVFMSSNIKVNSRIIGKNNEHLKMTAFYNDNDTMEAIGFNLAEKYKSKEPNSHIDIVYNIAKNQWNGKEIIQLNIKDLR